MDVEEGKMDKVSAYFGASGSFAHGFIATLSVILVSELGDKTFFRGKCRCHVRFEINFLWTWQPSYRRIRAISEIRCLAAGYVLFFLNLMLVLLRRISFLDTF